MEDKKITIAIDMEEYKELLMIKGRYEELKEKQTKITVPTYRENSENKRKYDFGKITRKLGGEA